MKKIAQQEPVVEVPPTWKKCLPVLYPDGRAYLPSQLYHGTGEKFLDNILQNGLLPRPEGTPGNWPTIHAPNSIPSFHYESRSNFVYLSDAFAPAYASNVQAQGAKTRALVLEINTEFLHAVCCFPDEDFLGQRVVDSWDEPQNLLRMEMASPGERNVIRKEYHQTVKTENNVDLLERQSYWPQSMAELGSIAYWGGVPKEAIARYALIDEPQCPILCRLSAIRQISRKTYRLIGKQLRDVTKFIFDGTQLPTLPFMSTTALPTDYAPWMRAMLDGQEQPDQYREALSQERALGVTVVTI